MALIENIREPYVPLRRTTTQKASTNMTTFNDDFKLTMAQIGPYSVSGDVNIDFDYETQTDTVDTFCGTRLDQTDVELFDVTINTECGFMIEIEHDDWPESRVISSDDDDPAIVHRWTKLLNEQTDKWWTYEITGANDIWDHIN